MNSGSATLVFGEDRCFKGGNDMSSVNKLACNYKARKYYVYVHLCVLLIFQ